MNPVVSVVTVAFNAENCIAKTIESVLAQTYNNFEYIFIDGESQDKTVDIIESYREVFESRGVRYFVLSEKDTGIYDAMNKSVTKAKGTWVQMLNAGDVFVDENVLADVFSVAEDTSDILYGDTILQDEIFYKIVRVGELENIRQNMPMCHQSIFVKKAVLEEYGFDLKYRLAADYNQILRAYLDGRRFQYVHKLIAVYDTSGESEKNFLKTITEQKMIRDSFGIEQKNEIKRTMFSRAKAKFFRHFLPMISRSRARGWYRTLNEVKQRY